MGEMAGRTTRAKCRQNIMQVLSASIEQGFVFKLRRKIQARDVVLEKVVVILPPHGPTLNQLLPGVGRIFKALWDH